jgi:hypothetical protein
MKKKQAPIVPFSIDALSSGFTMARQDKVASLRRTSERTPRHIGVADIDVFVGYLPDVFRAINQAQKAFQFEKVLIPIRAGLPMSGERTRQIVRKVGQRITKYDIANNVYAPDLRAAARPVLKKLALDVLGVLVKRMILEEEEPGRFSWNLFWTGESRTFIVSAYDVADYADEAGRPIEACVASMAVAAALAALFPKIETHLETRGCLFDYCEDRSDIVRGFREMAICAESLALFPEWAQAPVGKVLAAIRAYERSDGRPARHARPKAAAARGKKKGGGSR